MNIGVSLVGVSYEDGFRNGNYRKVDFNKTANNIIESIIKPLSKNNNVFTYLTTYPHPYLNNLCEIYNPKKSQILQYSNSRMQLTYEQSMKQIINEDLDFVISTRFDIQFLKKIDQIEIDFNKMNVLFREKGYRHKNYTCDNFYAFPKNMLPAFTDSIRESLYIDNNGLHYLFNHFCSKININQTKIIDETDWVGRNNPYYYLPSVIREGFPT